MTNPCTPTACWQRAPDRLAWNRTSVAAATISRRAVGLKRRAALLSPFVGPRDITPVNTLSLPQCFRRRILTSRDWRHSKVSLCWCGSGGGGRSLRGAVWLHRVESKGKAGLTGHPVDLQAGCLMSRRLEDPDVSQAASQCKIARFARAADGINRWDQPAELTAQYNAAQSWQQRLLRPLQVSTSSPRKL